MKRMILISSVLLISAVFAIAQYESQPSTSGQSSMNTGSTTVQGCLSQSGSNYILTDKSGSTYQIAGDTSKLHAHVGHTVQLTGTVSGAANSSGAMGNQTGSMSGSTDTQRTLTVTSLKHVKVSCDASH